MFSNVLMAAEQAAPVAAAAKESMWEQMIPILLIFAVVYFIMIRPQAKKAKEQSEMLSKIKPGDEVVTSGGIIGRIKSINEEFFSIDTGSAVLKLTKGSVSRLNRPSPKKK